MLQQKLGLSEEGARDFRRGVFFCALANLVLMAPVGVFYLVTGEFVTHLENPAAPLPSVGPYLAAIVAVLAAMYLSQWAEYRATYGTVFQESSRKRIALAERLRELPLSFFGRKNLSDLTASIMKDCSDQERMFQHIMPQLFGTGISTVLVAAALLVFDWRLALAALWAVPVAVAIVLGSAKRQQAGSKKETACRLALGDGVQEFIECAREIRSSNRSAAFLEKLHGKIDDFERSQIGAELTTGALVASAQTVMRMGIATTVLIGSVLIASGQIDFMVFFAFLLVVTRIYDPINAVLEVIAELLGVRLSLERIRAIMDEPAQQGSKDFSPKGYDVSFKNVSFSYGDEEAPVLSDVSFVAAEGEVTALVGPSGGGKSTCAKLAARLWDADGGTIEVGGVDISTVDPEVLLSKYSQVFQDVVLFDDTVMENIRLGKSDASDEEVLAAARAANCDEFVRLMPNGYETTIGENGSLLSGGERQRVSIARALLKDAPIVLLDEATASLDVENETQVQEALSRLLAGKTVLVIAHRMRTVLNADKVVVLKDGKVFEQGRPKDLLEAGGLFRRMVDLQNASSRWSIGS
ncbi:MULTISPECIES: ABC transporter ATP-binding protein [Gordonibacter]|uniref:ATP-binding cassette domain-containing protein n=1 Tax=Gordonibacter urolithinfaciens TaxID=1335613 RepID=A0A6N8INZ1_9ACTN|nr:MULTISPECIES: ABC transporter ATP-binding protein [Gordonibacter]HIR43621.1 ABC transporter ATP-binding protein [Candidatus Aphodovivens avicola]MVM56027.1 ATP-binding cassette domain-containing protein [Gordonibacter urolithinfaciens]MVN16613.1 ATP-binding cassette domain-containing protein [Gordonibacter urolithinfaciens]MVN40077.1 ATP-binding cassette domain-containing protein [Gordonibacter urolithinfaciens]MVN56185.1 ATP-binding cassette domain-containing protein [Gordonibacter urolith